MLIAGRYTLQQKIGEGGMGEVWVAKQSEPVKRKVALKLIKTGMDSKAVSQRFEQERQALALMDHPNIAKVLDAGLTPTGQPFFVMELVNGLPLSKFCDEMKLTTRERLELFISICQAVQHAHQKGIVHRDLKPANILVTICGRVVMPGLLPRVPSVPQTRWPGRLGRYTPQAGYLHLPAQLAASRSVLRARPTPHRCY